MLPSWYTSSLVKLLCTCWRQEIEWKPWHQEHTAYTMVILESKKEELHEFFSLEANIKSQDTFFMAYDWTTRPGKISPCSMNWEPHLSPWKHNGCKSRPLRGGWSLLTLHWYLPGERKSNHLLCTHAHFTVRTCLSLHPLFSAYPY